MRRAFFVLLLLSFMAGKGRIAWPASYDFTTIDVPNSQGTGANRINDRGQIVGNYGDVSGRPLGFLLSGGTFTTIDVPNSDGTDANGINNQGQIVGTFGDPMFHGFLLSRGTFTTIDIPDGF